MLTFHVPKEHAFYKQRHNLGIAAQTQEHHHTERNTKKMNGSISGKDATNLELAMSPKLSAEGSQEEPPAEAAAPSGSPEKSPPVLKRPAGKAKAKSSAKAKTKAKEKSKPKGVMKSTLKAKDKKTGKDPQAKPKPKAKSKSLKEMTEKWKNVETENNQQQEGEEEEAAEQDECVEEKELRDYNKARKWARLMKSNSIPDDLKQMYESGGKNAEQPRLWQTKFINAIFTKNDRGEHLLSPGNPSFTAFRGNTESRTSAKGSTGVPYSIMLWQYFHGREDAMADAERRGDIKCIDNMWHYATQSVSRSKTTTQAMKVSGGEAQLTLDQFQDLNSFLGSRPWAKFGSSEEIQDSSTATSSAGTSNKIKAICDKPAVVTFASMEDNLKEAKGAQERLLRDAQRLASKIAGKGDAGMVATLKTTMPQLSKNESSLNEALLWKEVPETNMEKPKVESFMSQLATGTEKCNEMLEQIKATCKARQWF